MRDKVLAGNWKMNKLQKCTKEFFEELLPLVKDSKNRIIICAPYTDLATAVELTKGSNVSIGAENVHWADKGAFTGEISAEMLKEIGVEYVIVGHSERRQYFGETDETVSKRTRAALDGGLKPIVCIGELLNERQNGETEKVLKNQIVNGFNGITEQDMANVIVAYEPVWAIGTGVTATNEQAEATIDFIRHTFAELYGKAVADELIIQYGGSMNDKNAADLLSMPNIDGGLIGGASLVPTKFSAIVHAK